MLRPIRQMRYLLLFALVAAYSLAAETIYLRDGRVLTGQITGQTRTDITINTPQGPMKIMKDQIRRIQYDTSAEDKAREDARRAEEQRRQDEQRRADEQRRQDEAKRLAEQKRLEDEKKKQEEDKKKLEADKARAEADKQRNESASKEEQERLRRLEARRKAAQELDERAKIVNPTWYGATARNLAIPGWGQLYENRKIGYLYAGAWAGLVTWTLYEKDRYMKNKAVYSATTRGFLLGTPYTTRNLLSYSQSDGQALFWFFKGYGQTSAARTRTDLHASRLRIAQTGLVMLYAWSITDAILFRPNRNTAVGFAGTSDGFRFAVASRF